MLAVWQDARATVEQHERHIRALQAEGAANRQPTDQAHQGLQGQLERALMEVEKSRQDAELMQEALMVS